MDWIEVFDFPVGFSEPAALRASSGCEGGSCDSSHKMANVATINWPKMPVLTKADWLMRGLCNHNVAESPDFQA